MIPSAEDDRWMAAALEVATAAGRSGEVPIGAVVVRNNEIIASGANRTIRDQDPTAHAEVVAIRGAAAVLRSWRISGCTLYVTCEPCAMCAGALVLSRVDRVVFGAWDDKAGMAGSIEDLLRHARLNHRPEVLGGVRALECGVLLTRFFKDHRDLVDSPGG